METIGDGPPVLDASSAKPIFIEKGWPVSKWLMEIRRDDKMLLRLDYEGGAEFGEDYTPEEAVRVFWDSMAGPGSMRIIERVSAAHGYKLVKEDA